MKKETQGKVKKTAATAASAVAGAATGVFFGSAISADAAETQEPIEAEVVEEQPSHSQPVAHHTAHQAAPHHDVAEVPVESVVEPAHPGDEINPGNEGHEPEPIVEPLLGIEEPPMEPSPLEGEIEVLSYERIPNMEGGEMDVAVLDVNGTEVAVVDLDLDGMADTIAADFNQNGIIEDGETMDIQGEGISMLPFQDAAGFHQELAENNLPDYMDHNLPDYMNDADVDNYMA